MRLQSIFLSSLFLLITYTASCQYYDTGQDPANLKWLQVKTKNFRVIYPESYSTGGLNYAQELEKAFSDLSILFPGKKIKIPVIIHNYTIQSNGYVAWAPKRMEIYPTPEQNAIPLDATRQMALHEMTHVMQMKSLNTGFSKAMSLFLGEQFTGITASLLPNWYLEGDAVYAESIFTASGRGRSSSFQKQLKAISIERGKMYNYDKLVNGSFKNYIPDNYQTGFQAIALSRLKYNPGVWNKVLKTTGNMPFLINPVNLSLAHNTGINKKQLFKETFDTLKTIWSKEIENNGSLPYQSINPLRKKEYVNYYSPVKMTENGIVAIRTSLANPPQFVLINTVEKSEDKIYVPGIIYPYYISGALSLLVWVETQSDPRWDNRNYSVIKLMDIRDKTVKQLTWKTRYLSASISPDGKTIAAIENSVDNKNNIILIDIKTGKVEMSFPAPDNAYLQRPQWSYDGTNITVISLTNEGEGILSFKPAEKYWETLIKEGTEDYQSTFLRNDSLFYVSTASGTENIYVLPPNGGIKKLTNSQFGATDLFVDGSSIMFSDYTSSGNNICIINLNKKTDNDSIEKKSSSFIIDNIKPPDQTGEIMSGQIYSPMPFRKWQHLIRFHSWMPFYANLEEIKADPRAIKPGFTIMSQNLLSTLISTLGYEYSDNRHKLHSQVTWKGWYPVFESRIDFGNENYIYKGIPGVEDPPLIKPGLIFTNTVSLPLTFSTGRFYQYCYPSLTVRHENSYVYLDDEARYDYGQTQLSARIYFANYHRSSIRDIYPRLAQVVDFNFSFSPFDNNIYGPFITLRTALYFPGFLRNNGIRFRYENDMQIVEKIPLWNKINLPRSYKNIASEELNFFSVDYVAPIVYPDINLLSFLYITRIRTAFFYDFARGTGNYYFYENENGSLVFDQFHNYTESFSSYGIELMSDFYVLRLPYMISAGVQAAWQKGGKLPLFELLLNIDIFGMNVGRSRL